MQEEPKIQKNNNQLPGAFQLFKPSWQAYKLNWVVFVFGILVPLLTIFSFVAVMQVLLHFAVVENNGGNSLSLQHSTVTAVNIVSVVLGAGAVLFVIPLSTSLYYYAKLQSAKGIKLKYWAAIKSSLHYFWRILGLVICRFIIILLGLVLLIVPGLFMIRRYMLAPYLLIDEDIGVFEAMRRSAKLSKPFSSALWGIMGVNILFSILGILPLLGYVVEIVFGVTYSCATAVRYIQIKKFKN